MAVSPSVEQTIILLQTVYGDGRDESGHFCWTHPVRACGYLERFAGGRAIPDYVTLATLLHDLIEDTRKNPEPMTIERLRHLGYDEKTLTLVDRLTKPKGAAYLPFIQSLIAHEDFWLVVIKRSDMEDNLSPFRMTRLPEERRHELQAKYETPSRLLDDALLDLAAKIPPTPIVRDAYRTGMTPYEQVTVMGGRG